ncbi:hypothetical protein [Natrialba sp. SSL1]|uniref:hypothetical protein n=1 Tax=Natrialba sp. SSL1 TaxID=1869245 RepID=UPI0009FEDD8C|nr:hypothetical protein [Natrialba sp. SSL1]
MGGVAAADDTTNSTANETSDQLEESGPIAQFSSGAVIEDYEFRDGYVWIDVQADRRTSVEIADSLAGIDQEGATEIPVETDTVRPGGGTVNAPVTEYNGGNSVTVTIDGQSVRLSTEMDEHQGENPFNYFGGTNGLFSGIGITVSLALGAAGFVLWREDNGVTKA